MFGHKGVKRVEPIEGDDAETVPGDDEGFSLEELGNAYAKAIEQSSGIALEEPVVAPTGEKSSANELEAEQEAMLDAPNAIETDGIPVNPASILEAMLFLGTSNNRPIASEKILELFRGVTSAEVEEAVDALNALYREHDRAMEIVREAGGYRMQLVRTLHLVRDRFYGKVKETQLTQSAIDCLSLIAYQGGITREEIEKQWNQPAAGILSMLVRKGLVRMEKGGSRKNGEASRFFTTERFLEIIGLESLEDLPHSEDV